MGFSPYFQTTHTWSLPNTGMSKNPMKPSNPTYTFSSQLVQGVSNG